MAKKSGKKKSAGKKKEVLDPNVLDKSFDKILAEASESAEQIANASSASGASSGTAAAANDDVDTSAPNAASSAVFAAMAVGPCAVLYASPKFGITLADKGVLLIAVAVLAIGLLTQAYAANVENARQTDKGRKTSTAELQNYAIFLINLIFLLLFLFVGFVVLPALGNLVPTEINYALTVAGNAVFVYLWQKGIILKGIA